MDPAGPRPSGFAPPSVLTPPQAAPAVPAGPAPGTTLSPTPSIGPAMAPSAAGSVLAPPPNVVHGTGGMAGESSFGPVSQVARISVRTLSSRIDLVLPDRSTIAETLETVLELAPRSLREQAIAHGGWILRTAAGEAIPGASTLLDQGIIDGTTLFLTGIDAANTGAVYDDVADAVGDAVQADPAVWPAGAGRAVALGAAGLFGAVACLSLLLAGPPWIGVAVILGAVAVVGQVAAGLLAHRFDDTGAAVVAGLLSVGTGAAAGAVATAGDARLLQIGAAQLLLGAAAAALLASSAALLIGTRQVAFEAIVDGNGAAVHRPGVLRGLRSATRRRGGDRCRLCSRVDATGAERRAGAGQVRGRPAAQHGRGGRDRRRDGRCGCHRGPDPAGGWSCDRAGPGADLAGPCGLRRPRLYPASTGQLLAGFVGVGMLLRARLFITIGQRLPLLIAGTGAIAALLVALTTELDGMTVVLVTAVPSLLAVIGCLLLAGRRRPAAPGMTRAAEIVEMTIAIAIVPLLAAVLGLFDFLRGLGG